jgi:multidrug efflux pump subunit AcrA (membrane-fusion protein)
LSRDAPATVSAENADPIYAVNVHEAVQGRIQDYLPLSGDIITSSTVDAYSDAVGKVSRIYVSVGQYVARGAALAAVDPSRPGMQYEANIVTAPVAGTIIMLPAQIGMTVAQSVPIARIAAGNELEIQLYVPERFVSRVALKQPCVITLDAWPADTFNGAISEIDPTMDQASRTLAVKVKVADRSGKLKAGMFAKVRIITETKDDVIQIPEEALLSRNNETYVFVAQGSGAGATAKKVNVKTGINIDGVLEVEEGLKSGDLVIVQGQSLLEDGAKINIVARQPSA